MYNLKILPHRRNMFKYDSLLDLKQILGFQWDSKYDITNSCTHKIICILIYMHTQHRDVYVHIYKYICIYIPAYLCAYI